MRRLTVLLGVLVASAALALPAQAHVTANPNEGPAGGFFKTSFRVGHGCEGEPTTAVRIRIPEGVVSVKPQVVPGWEIELTEGPIAPYDNHGETVTEGVTEVAWVGGSLPDEHMQEFGLSMRLPESDAEALYFPVVQECPGGGAHRWIEIPDSVDAWGDLDEPAPFVRLTAGGGGHGGGADDEASDPMDAEGTSASAPDDGTDPLSLAAVGLSVVALLLAAGARLRGRRSSP